MLDQLKLEEKYFRIRCIISMAFVVFDEVDFFIYIYGSWHFLEMVCIYIYICC